MTPDRNPDSDEFDRVLATMIKQGRERLGDEAVLAALAGATAVLASMTGYGSTIAALVQHAVSQTRTR